MNDVVLTGASGFVGSALSKTLGAAGCRVIPVQIRKDPLPRLPDAVCVHLASSNDPADIEKRYDAHLAEGKVLAQKVLDAGYRRVVFASSALVYGDKQSAPRRETDALDPAGAYGRLKASLEPFFKDHVVARLSNVYGPGMSPVNVFSHILGQLDGKTVKVRNLVSVRDYLFVDDAATGLCALALADAKGVFNVSTGRGASVDEIIDLLCAARGAARPRVEVPPGGDKTSVLVLDPAKLKAATGFAAKTLLKDGLKTLVAAGARA